MENQVLNEIKKFANSYGFEDTLEIICAIPSDVEDDELKKGIEKSLVSIHSNIKKKIVLIEDDNEYDNAEEALKEAARYLTVVIANMYYVETIEEDTVNEINDFLNHEEAIIKEYTDIMPRKTMSGRTNGPIKVNGEKLLVGGVAVVVVGSILAGIIAIAVNNKKKKDETNSDTPKSNSEEPSTITPARKHTSNSGEKIVSTTDISESAISASAAKTYESWSKTTAYTKEDIENVIRALYGLDSTLTLDEADAIIDNVIANAAIPRVNNILVGSPYEIKNIDVASLLVGDNKKVVALQNILNSALTTNNIEDTAYAALKEEVLAYNNSALEGMCPAERIIWARLAIYINAIHGTLGEDFYIEYNGNIYTQKEILESSILEEIIKTAKSEIEGKNIIRGY